MSNKLKLYAYSVSANCVHNRLLSTKSSYCTAYDKYEATGRALDNASKRHFPASYGYYNHQVSVCEVDMDTLVSVYDDNYNY